MINKVWLSFIFLLFPLFTGAVTVFSPNCQTSLYQILNFDFIGAQISISAERKINPSNLYIPYLENYIDFIQVVFTESPVNYKRSKLSFPAHIHCLEQSNELTPYKNFFLTEINLQASIISAKFNQKYKAFKYLNAAQKAILENQKLYPGFSLHNKHLPVVLLVNKNLPQIVKRFAPIVIKSDKPFELLQKYRNEVASDSVLKLESDILWAFLLYQFGGNPKNEYSQTRPLVQCKSNSLLLFSISLNAISSGNSKDALDFLRKITANKNSVFCPFFQYLKGEIELNTKLDGSSSLEYFVCNYKGNNFLKTAWLKLGWCYFLRGDTAGYNNCKNQVKLTGVTWSDTDAQSVREVTDNGYPNIFLLKARILFDGGLYHKSRECLAAGNVLKSLISRHDQIEYIYRFARINHAEGDFISAKKYYSQVIQLGSAEPYYFAANSALQLGLIYELESDWENAAKYYALCISLNRFGYSGSIGNKAKTGLKRINR